MKKIHILISLLLLSCVFYINAQEKFLTAIPTTKSLINDLPVDTKIQPQASGSSASSFYTNQGIDKAMDNNMSTFYHSAYGSVGTTTFPVTLKFAFPEGSNVDYLVYYPRTNGSNGNIGKVAVHYKLKTGEEVKHGNFDFAEGSDASSVAFDKTLENVEYIKFVVNSGSGGFVSCAEMQFYQKNPKSFDYKTIFTDASCSTIKEGVTAQDINKIGVEFYKKLAEDIFYGDYDKEFRIQKYEAYVNPEATAAANKFSFCYGKRDNPTGIYATKGETIIAFVQESQSGIYPSLFIQQPGYAVRGTSFILQPGLNKITAPYDGLMYVLYYTTTGEEEPLTVNIVTGTVNGYFELGKHTNANWQDLLDKATFQHFDLIGEYSTLTFETDVFRKSTGSKVEELIKAYDNLVYLELDFLGLFKYERPIPTRMYFVVMIPDYSTNFMHATNYYTGYSQGTQSSILNYDTFTNKNFHSGWAGGVAWGPAHEVGHVNQLRPGLKWHGMTEVTNNIMSQYVTRTWGLPSRLNDEVLDTYGDRYKKAIETIVKAKAPHNAVDGDVFCKLVPFWQLKLYMDDVLNYGGVYKDIYEKLRNTPNLSAGKNGNSIDGQYQLDFTKVVCEVTGYDFTEFFEDWGFYTPISELISDYYNTKFTVTEVGATAVKEAIKSLGLPKPPVPEGMKLYELNDKNTESYKVK